MKSLELFVFIAGVIYVLIHVGDWLVKHWLASIEAEWTRERSERQRIASKMIQEYRRAEWHRAADQASEQ